MMLMDLRPLPKPVLSCKINYFTPATAYDLKISAVLVGKLWRGIYFVETLITFDVEPYVIVDCDVIEDDKDSLMVSVQQREIHNPSKLFLRDFRVCITSQLLHNKNVTREDLGKEHKKQHEAKR